MVAQRIAEAAHLGGAAVAEAKGEGTGGGQGVQGLEPGVVLEHLEGGPVAFPEELEPGRHELTVGALGGALGVGENGGRIG